MYGVPFHPLRYLYLRTENLFCTVDYNWNSLLATTVNSVSPWIHLRILPMLAGTASMGISRFDMLPDFSDGRKDKNPWFCLCYRRPGIVGFSVIAYADLVACAGVNKGVRATH